MLGLGVGHDVELSHPADVIGGSREPIGVPAAVPCDVVVYETRIEGLQAAQLGGGFFEGWATPLTPEEHLAVLRAAAHAVVAVDGEEVVGFVNALSDGVLSAYLPLLEVLPGHRDRGIGSELVRRVVAEIGPLYMVDVLCDAEVFGFYERLGFARAGGGMLRRYDWRDAHRS